MTLQPHGLQQARLPFPSLSPRVWSNSCPLSWRCHPTISSSVAPFFSCLQSFPASESFLMSQFFASGGQSIGTSALESVLPMNIQGWFRIDWFDLLAVQGTLKSLLPWEMHGETVETVSDFILGGSKITADGDCSHEIKRRLLLGRKVMTNLDSIFKSRDITLPTKVCLVKAMVF